MIPNPCLASVHSAETVLALSPVVEAGATGLFAVATMGQGELQQIYNADDVHVLITATAVLIM